jgi:hypothetical protein
MNQTAHISLQIFINFKERRDKRNKVRPKLSARPASITSDFIVPPRLSIVSDKPVWRPAAASLRRR